MNTRIRRFISLLAGVLLLSSLTLIGSAPAHAVEAEPITPAPVTFAGCYVTIPVTPNVAYFLEYSEIGVTEVAAGTHHTGPDYNHGQPIVFFAKADEGFELADGAITEWQHTVSDDCGGNADLVTAKGACDSVTFTSVADETVTVRYADHPEEPAETQFPLEPGGFHTIHVDPTVRDRLQFWVSNADDSKLQDDGVLLGCGGAKPTAAPAAGR